MNSSMKDLYEAIWKEYPDLMDIHQMSRALGISTKTGYKLIREEKITAMKVGRSFRIPKFHLLKYLKVMDASSETRVS